MDDATRRQREALRKTSTPIHGAGPGGATAELERVAQWCAEQGVEQDVYGAGALIEEFEERVASLLGLEAARFLPSGTMAQGIAMRIWCGPGGHFGMHPTSHLELHEERGYAHLFGLRSTLVGPARRPMLARDLAACADPLDALLVELPTRENGGQLPSWDELVELCSLARERGMALHLDGARLWEAQAGYDLPFDQICGLFDSVYVSFYKGIGALSGAMLLGSAELISEAKLWQRRMGGNLYTLLPNVASAASRLEAQLERFPAYLARARSLARALSAVQGVRVLPEVPQVNMMHVHLDLSPDAALAARDRVAHETGLWLFGNAAATALPDRSRFELYVGEAAMAVEDEAVAAAFAALFT